MGGGNAYRYPQKTMYKHTSGRQSLIKHSPFIFQVQKGENLTTVGLLIGLNLLCQVKEARHKRMTYCIISFI